MGLVRLNGPNGKRLRNTCEPVTDYSTQVDPYVQRGLEIIVREEGIGLAAPQMGVPYRWYLNNKGEVIINPEIVETGEPCSIVEGCLSIPGRWFEVDRFKSVTMEYDNGDERIRVELDGFDAYVAQHECDHLDGRLISDHGTRRYAGD